MKKIGCLWLVALIWGCDIKQTPPAANSLLIRDLNEFNLTSVKGLPLILELSQFINFDKATTIKHLSSNGELKFLDNGSFVRFSPKKAEQEIDTLVFNVCPQQMPCYLLQFFIKVTHSDSLSLTDAGFYCFKGAWDDFIGLPMAKPFEFDVMKNDYLCKGGLDPNTLRAWSLPKFGRLNTNNKTWIYQPERNFQGLDTFVYQVSALNNSKRKYFAYVILDVGECRPRAIADSFNIKFSDKRFNINVLNNDLLCGSAPELKITKQPAHLQLQIVSPREIVCVRLNSFQQSDEFEYSLTIFKNNNQPFETESVKVSIFAR